MESGRTADARRHEAWKSITPFWAADGPAVVGRARQHARMAALAGTSATCSKTSANEVRGVAGRPAQAGARIDGATTHATHGAIIAHVLSDAAAVSRGTLDAMGTYTKPSSRWRGPLHTRGGIRVAPRGREGAPRSRCGAGRHDAIVLPTLPIPRHRSEQARSAGCRDGRPKHQAQLTNRSSHGNPAISITCGRTPGNCCGIQLVGTRQTDALLSIAPLRASARFGV